MRRPRDTALLQMHSSALAPIPLAHVAVQQADAADKLTLSRSGAWYHPNSSGVSAAAVGRRLQLSADPLGGVTASSIVI